MEILVQRLSVGIIVVPLLVVSAGCSVSNTQTDSPRPHITERLTTTSSSKDRMSRADSGYEDMPTPMGRVANDDVRQAAKLILLEGLVSIQLQGFVLSKKGHGRSRRKITSVEEMAFIMKAFLNSSRKVGATKTGGDGDSSDTIWIETAKSTEPYKWYVDSADVHDYWGPDMVRVYARYAKDEDRKWFTTKKKP